MVVLCALALCVCVFALPFVSAGAALAAGNPPAAASAEPADSAQPEGETGDEAAGQENETVSLSTPETPMAMPAPEGSAHVGHPGAILLAFAAILAVIVLIRIVAVRVKDRQGQPVPALAVEQEAGQEDLDPIMDRGEWEEGRLSDLDRIDPTPARGDLNMVLRSEDDR